MKHSDQRLLEQTVLKEGEQDKHVPTEIQIVMFFSFKRLQPQGHVF